MLKKQTGSAVYLTWKSGMDNGINLVCKTCVKHFEQGQNAQRSWGLIFVESMLLAQEKFAYMGRLLSERNWARGINLQWG